MKRYLALAVLAICASVAFAQSPPTVPKPPEGAGSTTGVTCEVWFYGEADVDMGEKDKDGKPVMFDGGESGSRTPGIPMAKVKRNHDAWMKVLDVMSKEQKDGPGSVIIGEWRRCTDANGKVGAPVQMGIGEGSIEVRGVTQEGANRIARAAIAQSQVITSMEETEEAKDPRPKNKRTSYDYKKAGKVERDDLGRRKKKD